MKTSIIINIKRVSLLMVSVALGLSSCTGNFEELNSNPTGLGVADLPLSTYFNEPQLSIYYNQSNGNWEYQLIQNLNADLYSGYLAVPTAFASNNNNSLYYMVDGWNSYTLNYGLLHVMKPVSNILKSTEEPDYIAIAKILRVAGMSKVTDVYGPIPYSKSMQGGLSVEYDSQEDIYKSFFADLEESINALTAFVDANGDQSTRLTFDKMCGRSHTTWLRYANTLRLRLAMRVVKVAPALAKVQAEAAVANKYGVLTAADANIEVKDANTRNPLMIIARDYNDCCVGASFESIMKGYNDPRLAKMVLPVGWKLDSNKQQIDITDKNGNATNSIGEVHGIRNGFSVPSSAVYKMYSIPMVEIGTTVLSDKYPLPIMKVAEAYFLRAEGALRGWAMGGDAESLYNEGIRVSLAEYGVEASYNDYVNDNTRMAQDYVDPYNSDLNIAAMNNVTVKFGGDNETKLQKIITQKWIAMFPEGQEAWSEFRRTGYPKLFPIVENRSAGLVAEGDFIKRLPFCLDERNNNPAGVASGVTLLGGADNIGTRLWWDVQKGNF